MRDQVLLLLSQRRLSHFKTYVFEEANGHWIIAMHTSALIKAEHFEYFQHVADDDLTMACDFDDCFPDYHDQDRLGVVAVPYEHGVLYTGFALLAFTTAFYDALRARGGEFFDYPQHYFFFDRSDKGVNTTVGRCQLDEDTVGLVRGLDVWPQNKWVPLSGRVSGMIQTIFDYHINRLFWPYGQKPAVGETKLPWHVKKMLRTRLKGVYYYNSPRPNIEIRGSAPAEKIVWETISRLRAISDPLPARSSPSRDVEGYEQVEVDTFLASIDSVLEAEPGS